MEPIPRILTKKEAAARLRLSDRSLDRLCATDSGIRKIQISPRRVGFLERDINIFIEKCVGMTQSARQTTENRYLADARTAAASRA